MRRMAIVFLVLAIDDGFKREFNDSKESI